MWKLAKPRGKRRPIDGATALAIGLEVLATMPSKRSVYDRTDAVVSIDIDPAAPRGRAWSTARLLASHPNCPTANLPGSCFVIS